MSAYRSLVVLVTLGVALVAAQSSAQPAVFLNDAATVTLDGVAVGQPLTPLGNSLRFSTAYDPVARLYHLWVVDTDATPFVMANVRHGTSRNGIAFQSDGQLAYSGGNPFPGLFGTTAEPWMTFLQALKVGQEWKLLVWTHNEPDGSFGQYNYNTSVNSFGTTPGNRLLVHQGRIGPMPGGVGIGGFHVGAFGIVNGRLYIRVDDLLGGLGRFTYTDGFLPGGPTVSSWGQHTTGDLFTGTGWVWGLSNPGAPNAAYVHNKGRTMLQADGTIGTYYAFRRWDGSRAEKQLWYIESADDGLNWSAPAPVFAAPALVTIDGAAIPANGFFSTVDAAEVESGGQRLYFSAANAGGQVVLATTSTFRLAPAALAVDTLGNGVLESGEVASVVPSWENVGTTEIAFDGLLDTLAGPGTSTYSILDDVATYGPTLGGATRNCAGDCYAVHVSTPAVRPALHWDAAADEALATGETKLWTLHVGRSFTDVPSTGIFYSFVETLLHNGVTAGCSASAYCPVAGSLRQEMPVFALRAREGASYAPPPCTAGAELFPDVPASNIFCSWIEELARRGVVAGCGGGDYCPANMVTRGQMAVFTLKTFEGAAYTPPPCTAGTELFPDVPASNIFCSWIEELARRGVVAGCGGGNYCPGEGVTREQMAVFVSRTFGLLLYRP